MWQAALLEHYYGYISGKVADLKYSRNRSESLQSIVEEVPINKKTHSMNFSKDQGSDKGSKFMSIFKAVTKTPSKLNGHGEATEIYRNLLHFCIACMTVLDLPKEIINEFADGSVKACRASLKQQNDIVDKLKVLTANSD